MAVVSKKISSKGNANNALNLGGKLVPCKVKKIILDPNSRDALNFGGHDGVGVIYYNKIKRRKKALGGINPDAAEQQNHPNYDGIAYPLFPHIKYYPLIGEVVTVITLTSKKHIKKRGSVVDYYFPPINMWNHQHHNTLPSPQNFTDTLKDGGQYTDKISDYAIEGLVRRPSSGSININISLGNYFKEQLNLKPLLPYEGDFITEGRFGNSIRFGSTARDINDAENGISYTFPKGENGGFDMRNPWSRGTKTNNGDPITVIRNGQATNMEDNISIEGYAGSEGWKHTVENINLDFASIYLTSTQNIANFQVAAPMCWYSFGLNTQPKQDNENEAQSFIEDTQKYVINQNTQTSV